MYLIKYYNKFLPLFILGVENPLPFFASPVIFLESRILFLWSNNNSKIVLFDLCYGSLRSTDHFCDTLYNNKFVCKEIFCLKLNGKPCTLWWIYVRVCMETLSKIRIQANTLNLFKILYCAFIVLQELFLNMGSSKFDTVQSITTQVWAFRDFKV